MNLNEITLLKGSHESREQGVCAMELVAWLAGEPHSDAPKCACPVIGKYVIGLNDGFNDEERQLLKPYLPRILNTRDGNGLKRAEILAMAAVTKITPHAIELIGLNEHAEKMRAAKDLIEAESAARTAASATTAEAARAARTAASASAYASAARADAADTADAAIFAADAAYYAASAAITNIRAQIIQEALTALDAVLEVK